MALSATAGPAGFTRSPHLVEMVAEAERLAAAVAGAPDEARRARRHGSEVAAVLASLRLDGSPTTEVPALAEGPDLPELLDALGTRDTTRDARDEQPDARDEQPDARDEQQDAPRTGTWIDTFAAADDPPDEQLQALEYLGTLAGARADDLAEALLTDPVPALQELHRRLTRGLVAPERAGATRQVDQAVHDASTGRIITLLPAPDAVPGELARLGAWLATAGSREHGLVVSGVVHLEVLRIHPFDAANGRLARAAARLVLRARGLDPDAVAPPDPVLAGDPLGYHEEVARTGRRRDLTIWLERWGEAVVEGLRAAARDLDVLDERVPDRAETFLTRRADPAFTVADYRAEAAAPPEEARADLAALLDTGRIGRVPGSRGLRFTVVR